MRSLPRGGLSELAFGFSLRALDQQEAAVNELRARTGTLLAASALVASFLGARAVDRSGYTALTTLGLIAFAVSIVASVFVLLPKPALIFAIRGSVLFEEEFDEPGGLSEIRRRLAYWLDHYHAANQVVIDRLYLGYRIAAGALLGEGILWMIQLAS